MFLNSQTITMGRPNTEESNLSLIDSNHERRGAYFSLICLLLCGALVAVVLDVRAALAALREKKSEVAHKQLKKLVAEFPENPLFAGELAKLKVLLPRLSPQKSEFLLSRMCLTIRRTWCLERHGAIGSNVRVA